MTAICRTCGQKIPFVPFTRGVLTRIKNGATANELGWDETFYISICRKHGLEIIKYNPPKTQAQPEIAATPSIAPDAPAEPLPPATGDVSFNASSREIVRGAHRKKLSVRASDVFVLLIKGNPKDPANGRRIAERLGMHVTGGIGGAVISIRNKLLALNLTVLAQSGRVNSGYWIADLPTAEPVTVKVLR